MPLAVCLICQVERKLIGLSPIAERYQLRSFECPVCKNVLDLVEHENKRVPVYGVPPALQPTS